MLRDLADGVFPVGPGDRHRADLPVLQITQAQSWGRPPGINRAPPSTCSGSWFLQGSGRSLSSAASLLPTNAPTDSRTGTACVAAGTSSDGCTAPAGPLL